MDRMHGARLSGTQLKGIALCSMLVDHLAALVLAFWIRPAGLPEESGWHLFYRILRAAGRPAFPIYAFLLVEGFRHTRAPRRYLARLTAFALISEIPYDLAYRNRPAEWTVQNIFFTLAIGLAVLLLLEHFRERPLLRAASLAGGCLAALLLRTEYDMFGVLLITAFYLLREAPFRRMLAVALLLMYETWNLWCAGLAALIPIGWYSGERGKVRRPLFFYWFYPAHLFLLYLLRRLVLHL